MNARQSKAMNITFTKEEGREREAEKLKSIYFSAWVQVLKARFKKLKAKLKKRYA